MTNTKAYPAYKESGVEWLGEIPEGWKAFPLRAIFQERKEKNEGPITEHILSVTRDRGVIPYDEKGAIGNNKSEEIERYKVVYPDDLVINKMNVIIGSLGLSRYHGALSQVYIVLSPRDDRFQIRFLSYLVSNEVFYKSLIKFCKGIMELRESLDLNEFKKLIFSIPSPPEQRAIADFLDDKVSKIDRAIAQKERLIELLQERKQIIIQNAVTKGLDPSVKMKDSGIEWIGQIPEHWEVRSFKYMTKFVLDGTHGSFGRSQDGFRLLSVRNLRDGILSFREDDSRVTEKSFREITSKFEISEGDVQLAIIGATLGKVGITPKLKERVASQRSLCTIRPKTPEIGEFISQSLTASIYQEFFWRNAGISAQPGIYLGSIQNMPFIVPSKRERERMVAYTLEQDQRFEVLVKVQQNAIQTLREYKATLIDSAVTGKIDVRSD